MPYLSESSSVYLFYVFPSGTLWGFFFLKILIDYMVDVLILIHEKQPLWKHKAFKAALVDPDVTAVIDGCGADIAKTFLFQSPIVGRSVITVYAAS